MSWRLERKLLEDQHAHEQKITHDVERIKKRNNRVLRLFAIDPRSSFGILPDHNDKIICVTGKETMKELLCDGLLTTATDTVLILRPADCLPILMTTHDQRFIGLIHAGWRGIDQEIARKAIQRVLAEYAVPACTIQVLIGPSIHRCCYNNEKLAERLKHDSRWIQFIDEGPLGVRINLLGFACKQLCDAGVTKEHISVAASCTCCATQKNGIRHEPAFFSHHRALKNSAEKEGRFLAVIAF